MRLPPIVIAVLTVYTAIRPVSLGAEEDFWPVDSPRAISSSFGEPRPGRYHFGVDFRSGGETGKDVYAFGDGYISQIRTSPFGYGKSLYLRLDSGETIVYGHLSRFLPEIEERLFHLRIQQKTYDVQIYPEPSEYRVTEGQVIASSGDTGSGGPHLHLEIRDINNNPVNPLAHGIKVRDTIPPFIQSAVLIPLDSMSSVDGFPVARMYDFRAGNDEPVHLSGRVGVAVSTWDHVNNSNNNIFGIYSVSLVVDSTVVFAKKYDVLPYLLNQYAGLDYQSAASYGVSNGIISALFRRTGNLINFYQGNGIFQIGGRNTPACHTFYIEAEDFSGNRTEQAIPVVYGERPVITACALAGDGALTVSGRSGQGGFSHIEIRGYTGENTRASGIFSFPLNTGCEAVRINPPQGYAYYRIVLVAADSTRSLPHTVASIRPGAVGTEKGALRLETRLIHDRIAIYIRSESNLASLPVVMVRCNFTGSVHTPVPIPESGTSWIAVVPLPDRPHNRLTITATASDDFLREIRGETEIGFTVMRAFSNSAVYAPDSLLVLYAPPGALYRTAPASIGISNPLPANGLKMVSPCYRIMFGDEPLKSGLLAHLTLDSVPSGKCALFFAGSPVNGNGNGRWQFISKLRSGTVFSGEIQSQGHLVVLEDTIPPVVIPTAPAPGSTVVDRKPLLEAGVEDRGAGIEGSDSIAMSIDGIPIYGEYDYEAHRVRYRLHNNLLPGNHTVRITVTDRVGNAGTREWSFTVR